MEVNSVVFPEALLTTLARINNMIPIARVENAATTRSPASRSLTVLNMTINSVRSRAAHTIASVSGLAAVTASNPRPHSVIEPAHANELEKPSRADAVSKMANASVTRLTAYGHESPSAENDGDVENKLAGCHGNRVNESGI